MKMRYTYLSDGTKSSTSSLSTNSAFRYRYAGKEEQRFGTFDSQLLDFGARYYDPWSCQWAAVDPSADKYSSISCFVYCLSNPVGLFDPDGLDPLPPAPKELLGTTEYYRWRYKNAVERGVSENVAKSYYLDYGEKYVKRFLDETKPKLSERGQRWVDEVAYELQRKMEDYLSNPEADSYELNADKFRLDAFKMHPDAYINEHGVELKTLPESDLINIILTIDFPDMVSIEGIQQEMKIVLYLLANDYIKDDSSVAPSSVIIYQSSSNENNQ